MFGINKNGTKHKIGIVMPSFFPASRTSYSNSSSGLTATNAQDAIDELTKDIFYKDIVIAGTVISNNYAQINTGISSADYLPIAVLDGAYWDEKCIYSLRPGTTNILLFVKCTASSYTIPASIDPVRVLCVKKSRLNATPIS